MLNDDKHDGCSPGLKADLIFMLKMEIVFRAFELVDSKGRVRVRLNEDLGSCFGSGLCGLNYTERGASSSFGVLTLVWRYSFILLA